MNEHLSPEDRKKFEDIIEEFKTAAQHNVELAMALINMGLPLETVIYSAYLTGAFEARHGIYQARPEDEIPQAFKDFFESGKKSD